MDEALKCNNLTVGYDGKPVLTDIDFELTRGTLAVLIGANGSGKSTLLRTLAGLKAPIAGNIMLCGSDIDNVSRRQLSRLRAIVSTSRTGGGALTVEETVAVGRNESISLFGGMSANDKEVVAKVMEDVGISSFAHRYLATLSDGERQKVMIARALAQDTPLIFLDEPTAFLDVAARIETMDLLRRLAMSGKSIVLSTHDIAPAVSRADYIIVADKSRKKVIVGNRDDMIASGALDAAFDGSAVKFDASLLDYR